MLASGVCFIALPHAAVETFKLVVVSLLTRWPAGLRLSSPVSVVLAPLLYLIWLSYRLYERRLEQQQKQLKKAAALNLRTIEALALAIEAKDQPMTSHSRARADLRDGPCQGAGPRSGRGRGAAHRLPAIRTSASSPCRSISS